MDAKGYFKEWIKDSNNKHLGAKKSAVLFAEEFADHQLKEKVSELMPSEEEITKRFSTKSGMPTVGGMGALWAIDQIKQKLNEQ